MIHDGFTNFSHVRLNQNEYFSVKSVKSSLLKRFDFTEIFELDCGKTRKLSLTRRKEKKIRQIDYVFCNFSSKTIAFTKFLQFRQDNSI